MSHLSFLSRVLRACCLSVLLLPAIAVAGEVVDPPLGLLRESSDGYRTMESCRAAGSKTLFEGMVLVVAGHYRCQPGYGEAKDYLVAYYGKQRFFVERSAVFMTKESESKLPQLDDQILAMLDFSVLEEKAQNHRHVAVGEALKAYSAPAKHGVSVLDFSAYDESEYTEATGLTLRVFNPTKKTIKYIRVEVVGINAVNDPVRDRFTGSAVKRVRGIGPIEPEDFGSYTFENLWFTDEVEWPRLVSLKVDYMDGSSKTIKSLKLVKVDQKHQDVMAWEDD